MRTASNFVALALLIGAASCDHDSGTAPIASAATNTAASIRAMLPDGSIFELKAAPRHVIPANAAAAEFIAPLLGPERIAALPEQVDDYSSFDFKSHGFEKTKRFARYSAEPLIVLHPDLVITHVWQAAETTTVLREQGTPVLVLKSATSYADIRSTILLCAKLFDLETKGAEFVADLDRRVARLREHASLGAVEPTSSSAHDPKGSAAQLRALVYSNDGSGGWAAGSDTTADTLLRLAGLRNAAAEAGLKGHVGVDFEKLIAIDPELIVVGAPARGEGGSATKSVLQSTAALTNLQAIKNQRIVVLSAALLASDSQCLVDGAEELARHVDDMHVGASSKETKKP